MAEKLKSRFQPMAKEMIKGLGPGRGSVIAIFIRNVETGHCRDIEDMIASIGGVMSTHDETRDQKLDIVLDPENDADWEKLGIPGGRAYLRQVHAETPLAPDMKEPELA